MKNGYPPHGKEIHIFCYCIMISFLLLSCGCMQQPTGSPSDSVAVPPSTPVSGIPEVTLTQPDSSHILITYPGSLRTEKLVELEISVTDSSGRVKTESMGSRLATTPVQYGSSHTITGSFEGKDRVFITGYFSDGSQKPIIDTTI
jgi:hypothetical protein